METIEVRGVEYKLVKARDFEVIVRSDNGFINYTKLCQQINDNRRPFSQLKKSETFQRLCIQMENSSGRIRPEQLDGSLYEQIKDRIEIEEGGRQQDPIIARISGTYMPRYLLDYVIMTCDIGYYKLIHELMDSIDQVAQERQVKFVEELQSNINLQKAKLEKRKVKINDLKSTVERLEKQIAYQNSLILQQNGELEETHNDVRDLLDLNMENSRNINDLMRVSKVMKNELKKHNVSNTSTETHKPQLVLFLSASIPGGKYKKIQPEHSIWIGTKCQEFERGIEHYLPDDADILFQSEVVGIDIIKFILDSTADIYIDSFYRQILIQDVNVEEFINRVNNIVIERGNHDAIINLKPITDRIKAREVQQQINDRRQRREQQCIELRQRIIDNHYTHINIFGEYRQIYCKDEEGHMTTELDPNKVFYVIRTVGRQRRKERLNIPMMRESEYR